MTSVTERIRAMLDEREEVWGANDTYRLLVTSWEDTSGHSWAFMEHRDGSFSKLTAYHLTPEQAIAATLGPGTCHDIAETPKYSDKTRFECSACGYEFSSVGGFGCDYGDEPDFNYCPNCGRRIEQ